MTVTLPTLPPRPLPPEGYDCCGGGCADCELTRYHRALKDWHQAVQAAEQQLQQQQ